MVRRVAYNLEGYRVGESHHHARYTDQQVDLVRHLHEREHMSYTRIADETGIPRPTVVKWCQYRTRNQTAVRWESHG